MPSATVDILSSSNTTPVPSLVVKLTRGLSARLGTLVAANTAVAFTIPEPTYWNQGVLIIQTSGTAGTTATLEGSIDGGNTFFVIPASTTPTLSLTGQLTGDAAATFAAAYTISGMGSGCLFKFGFAGAGVPTATVFALVG